MAAHFRSLALAVCAALAAAAFAAPASANIFAVDGHDPRAPQPRTGPDRLYAPVGVIVTGGPVAVSDDGARRLRTRGSAFLVSPCYVLTNYHAVFGLEYGGPDPNKDYSATFSVGADPDYPFRWVERATPVRWGAFNKRKEHDWALLKLDGCVGGEPDLGWLELSPQARPNLMGATVTLAGYPADKPTDTLWAQGDCLIEGPQPGTAKVLHECSVRAGASGGPLIQRGAGGAAAVAIQCGELNSSEDAIAAYEPRYANTAVTIAEVFEDSDAKALIDADKAAFPGANPALESAPPSEPAAPTVVAAAPQTAPEAATAAVESRPLPMPDTPPDLR